MGINDIFVLIILLLLYSFVIHHYKRGLDNKQQRVLKYLLFYHLFFGIIFWLYVSVNGGDALGYWRTRGEAFIPFSGGQGTVFMHSLNYVFVDQMHLSFFTGSMIYTFIGFLGVVYVYLFGTLLITDDVKVYNISIFPSVLFLPNLHFWSSGVGKDTLLFFCIGLFFYSTLKPIYRFIGIIFALTLSYYVRPHMTIFMLASYSIAILLDRKLKSHYKFLLTVAFSVGTIFIFDDVMEYVKLDEVSAESFDQYSDNKVFNLSRDHTGSSIDVTSYPLPFKIFTFLFRPLFFDAHNISSVLASLENILLLFLTYLMLKSKPIISYNYAPFQVKAMILFVLIGSLAFSNILGNLGIMVRMKNMFTPSLIIFISWVLSFQKTLLVKQVDAKKNELRRKVRLTGPRLD